MVVLHTAPSLQGKESPSKTFGDSYRICKFLLVPKSNSDGRAGAADHTLDTLTLRNGERAKMETENLIFGYTRTDV